MSGRLATTAAATGCCRGYNDILPRIVAQLQLKDAVAVPAAAALPIEAPHADWG